MKQSQCYGMIFQNVLFASTHSQTYCDYVKIIQNFLLENTKFKTNNNDNRNSDNVLLQSNSAKSRVEVTVVLTNVKQI